MRRISWRLSADGTLCYWWNESFFKEGTERLWGPLLCPSQSPKAAIISVTRLTQIACWTTYYKNWKVGGSGWGIHVTPRLIHVNVWQNPLQCCEVISLQLIKINEKKKKKKSRLLSDQSISPSTLAQAILHRRGQTLLWTVLFISASPITHFYTAA